MSTNDEAETGRANGTHGGVLKEEPQVRREPVLPGFSIDDIMWRVRAEVTRRRNGLLTSVAVPSIPTEIRSFDLSMPRWKPATPRLPTKDTYHVAELLAYSDADFLDVAYHAILRRPPDEVGFNHFLRLLRSSQATKLEVLAAFLASPESKPLGVRIEGFQRPALLEKWRRKRLIGPIIAWAHAFVRLGKQVDRQAIVEASKDREIQELGRMLNEASEHLLQRVISLRVEFGGRVGAAEFEALKKEYEATDLHVERLAAEMEIGLASRPDRAAFDAIERAYASLEAQLSSLEAEVRAGTQARASEVHESNGRMAPAASSIQNAGKLDKQAYELARGLEPFYAAFEDHFRGDRKVIRSRVEPYLDMVREAGAGSAEAPVWDIGCGRGEWLELLRDSGLTGHGIEINRVFIDMCRGRGLEVIEGDAIESLQKMPDGSVGAVTSMHLIEHLPFEVVIALLDEARRVLRPGGLLILETPNPENLSVGHHWFYMDPTHRNPLPPESLSWIVEARGFHDVRIERLFVARELNVPAPLPEDLPGAAAVNALLASMRAAQDYAIVAKRP